MKRMMSRAGHRLFGVLRLLLALGIIVFILRVIDGGITRVLFSTNDPVFEKTYGLWFFFINTGRI